MQPYSQDLLERLADELTGGDVGSLIMRDPSDPEDMWSVWQQAKPRERRQIVEIAKTLVRLASGMAAPDAPRRF